MRAAGTLRSAVAVIEGPGNLNRGPDRVHSVAVSQLLQHAVYQCLTSTVDHCPAESAGKPKFQRPTLFDSHGSDHHTVDREGTAFGQVAQGATIFWHIEIIGIGATVTCQNERRATVTGQREFRIRNRSMPVEQSAAAHDGLFVIGKTGVQAAIAVVAGQGKVAVGAAGDQ